MYREERAIVLKLLEEGKIDAKDAERLLDALKGDRIDSFIEENADRLKNIFTDIKSGAEKFAKKMEPNVNDAKEKMEAAYKKIEPKVKDVGDMVKKATSDLASQIAKRLSSKDETSDINDNKEEKEN